MFKNKEKIRFLTLMHVVPNLVLLLGAVVEAEEVDGGGVLEEGVPHRLQPLQIHTVPSAGEGEGLDERSSDLDYFFLRSFGN